MESKRPPSTVRGVMSKPVVKINIESSVREAAKLMSRKNVGSIVVTHEGRPVGIVTERDMVKRVVAKGLEASKARIGEIMSQPLNIIPVDLPIIDAIRKMQKEKIRRLLIMEEKKLLGIVTQRDLLRALAFHVIISFRPLLKTS
ncbi:MAG: CBS domain-containing protein [Candidatus Bathyarchaeota archaeon]|nr:MAG: CBS domain-containing protein [Candidatus Bathyarchaeota archaeon]